LGVASKRLVFNPETITKLVKSMSDGKLTEAKALRSRIGEPSGPLESP
jgi:hypothetical protein